jgi:hypothetical protein
VLVNEKRPDVARLRFASLGKGISHPADEKRKQAYSAATTATMTERLGSSPE